MVLSISSEHRSFPSPLTERVSLESWVNSVTVLRSPVTQEVVTQYKAFPNTNLVGLIRHFRKENDWEESSSDEEEEADDMEGGH